MDSYIAQQESEAERSIRQLPVLKQEYERHLLLKLFDFHALQTLQQSMVRIFAEFFYHSHAQLKQLQDQTLYDFQTRVIDVAQKWQQKIQAMDIIHLRDDDFLERVKRSADYFAKELYDIFREPILLSFRVETGNKQAARRLENVLPELRQACLSHRFLLLQIAKKGYSVENYLHEKQMSTLDAMEKGATKTKRRRKTAKKTS